MLAGIGVLIFASQFHVMLDDAPRAGGLANIAAIPEAIIKVFPADGSVHHLAAMAGIITIATIILWNKFKPKRLALLPGPLLGVIVGTTFAVIFALPITLVAVPVNLTDALNIPTTEALKSALDPDILTLGIVFAFVASAETLLCATAVDKMHIGVRTQYDKELRAQGIGNLICGALGALPMTGVIVRSAANVEAGATSRISAILHGGWLLLAVVAFPFVLNEIPTAVLAAILVYTGYKLVNVAQIRKIAEFGRQELAIYFVTLIGVVAIDLLTGVILGFVLATLKLVYTFSHLSIKVTHDAETNRSDVWMTGSATFFSIPQLSSALENAPRGAEVHIHVEKLDYIDHACLEMLASWEKLHHSTGGSLIVEWNELVERYGRRSQDPSKTEIPALMQRPAA
jgi:MFS superfamily sulfate permease-like transporter